MINWSRCLRSTLAGLAVSTLIVVYAEAQTTLPPTPCAALDVTDPFEDHLRCARLGDAIAQNVVGSAYEFGWWNQPQDDVEAIRWYRLAAEQGASGAQLNLGKMYEQGRGVSRDSVQAYMWYVLASGQGNRSAGRKLAAIEAQMNRDEISAGQRLAQEWCEAHPESRACVT